MPVTQESEGDGLQVPGQLQQFSETLSDLGRHHLKKNKVEGWGCRSLHGRSPLGCILTSKAKTNNNNKTNLITKFTLGMRGKGS